MDDNRDRVLPRQHSPKDPKTGTAGTQSPEKFGKHIEGVEWPATKDQLMEKARSTAAPGEIIRAIERLPGRTFADKDEVLLAYESEHPNRGSGHGRP